MKVVVITGSRKWTAVPQIRSVLWGADLVIHGGAKGADQVASQVAKLLDLEELIVRARWEEFGKRAGPERNERMADWAGKLQRAGHEVACYAYPLDGSRGTPDCIDRMLKHGIKVHVHGEPA